MQDRTKQTTLAGFFGKPKAGAAPPRPASASSKIPPTPVSQPPPSRPSNSQNGPSSQSPASTSTLKTPSSFVESPQAQKEKERKRAGSPLKQSFTIDDEDDGSLSPPPVDVEMKEEVDEVGGESMEVVGEGRRAKRKVVYAESGDSDSEDDVPLQRGSKGNFYKGR
jgi:hypothetical protein